MAIVKLYQKNKGKTVRIEQEEYFGVSFKTKSKVVKINEVLPFRIKFTATKIPGYGPNNVPAIPLQIIGYSNYIL